MSFSNVKPSDRIVLMGVVDPDANTAATYATAWVSMADFGSVLAVVFAGDLGSSATLDAKLEQATSSGGAGAKDVTGKAITTLTQAGTDSNKQAAINCRADELDVANSFTHVRLSMTVATATSDCGGAIFGLDARYAPHDAVSSLDEVID
jgi:hypothetical protein